MRRLVSLLRAELRSNFGLSLVRYRLFVQKKDRWLVPLIAMSVVGVLPLVYALVLLVREVYQVLEPLGQERALLLLGVMTGQIFVLFFGLYYVVSAFYFSRNLEFLVPLPLRGFEVVASKFVVVLANEYLTIALVVLPVVAGYGVMAGGGPGYWLNALLVYLLLPVIPLAIASILVVVLMRAVNISRKKDAVIVAGSILLIVLAVSVQFLVGGAGGAGLDAAALTTFMTSPDSLLNLIGSRFPPAIWASKAVAGGFSGAGLLNLALFAGTSLLCFGAVLVAAERLFYRGLIGLGETAARRRTLTRTEMSGRVSSGRRPVRAIFVREWRIMNRTPVFLLNGTLVVVIVPALLVAMAKGGSGDAASFLRVLTSANPLLVTLVLAGFMVACGSLNGTASSTFSREGAQFWISRIIPVAPREQVAAKFIHSYLVSLLGTATASVVAVWMLRPRAVHLAAAIGLSLLTGLLFTAVGMLIDLARPLLDWTNPQKAIKQNLNVLFALAAQAGLLAGFFLAIRVMMRAEMPAAAVLAVLYVALAALSAASYRALVAFAGRRYQEIEV